MPDVYNMSDIFLSYSRRDKEMCRRLFDSFKALGKEVWADFEDIPLTADWWAEIQAGINAADSFVFIISPDSVRSEVCWDEIQHAVDMNKRIIPVLYREVLEDNDKEKIHPSIGAHNWVFIREADDYDAGFQALLASVETDLEHNRTMTRLLVRAREWVDNNKGAGYLLRGEDLSEAETWLTEALHKKPEPTPEHTEYITASRQVEANRQRQLLGSVSIALVIAIVLAVFSLFQWNEARNAREAALVAQAAAEQSAIEAESLALAANSGQSLINNDPDLALTLALESVETDDSQPQSQLALASAAYAPGTRAIIRYEDGVVNRVAYNADGSRLLVGTRNGLVCIWNTQSNEQVGCIGETGERVHEGEVFGIRFAGDASFAVSLGEEGNIFVWDTEPTSDSFGSKLAEYNHPVGLGGLALYPDETRIMFGDVEGTISVWEWQGEDDPTRLPQHHNSSVQAMEISPSGHFALTGARDGTAYLWDLERNLLIHTEPALHFASSSKHGIMSFDFNHTETEALSSGRDDLIYRWDLENPGIIRAYEGHNDPVTHAVFAPGNIILSSSWDNSIRTWDIETGGVVREFFGHTGGVNDLALHPDGSTFVTGSFDRDIRVWTINSFLVLDRFIERMDPIETMAMSHSGEFVVIGNDDGTVMRWDLDTGDNTILIRHTDTVRGVSISPDDSVVATIGSDGLVHVVDIDTQRRRWGLSDLEGSLRTVQFTYHGTLLYVVRSDLIEWYDTTTEELVGSIPYDRSIQSFALSHDDTQALVGLSGATNNVHLIDLATGDVIYELDGHNDGVLSVAFNLDGTLGLSGSFDNSVRLWDLQRGEELRAFRAHSDRILSVKFSPTNPDEVISASNDQTIRMWSIETGFEKLSFEGHIQRVTDVDFTPDGQRIVSVSQDRTVIVWRLPHDVDALQDWALSNRFVRTLSCFERELYRVEPFCEES